MVPEENCFNYHNSKKNAISPKDTKKFMNKLFMSFLYDDQFSVTTELKTM